MTVKNVPVVGVVIVSFHSGDVILECLESLLASVGVELKIVIVDNASTDDTVEVLHSWASGERPFARPESSPLVSVPVATKPIELVELRGDPAPTQLGSCTLIVSEVNRGYAGAVNVGVRALDGQVDWVWVLNPDCVVPPSTARAFVNAASAHPGFSLMGGRTLYYSHPDKIQSDGGKINNRTGVCSHFNAGASFQEASPPSGGELSWVSGASIFVSPLFIKEVGLMSEGYFLYYEEVDWAFRRGDMPLALAADAVVYHHGGTSIGSGSISRRATPFANYFNHRNRIRFARRFLSAFPVWGYAYGMAKATQLALKGGFSEAQAVVAGMFELRPPRNVAARIRDPAAARLAFGRDATTV